MQTASVIQNLDRQRIQTEEELKIQQEMADLQAKIASNRYRNGCVIVVAQKAPDKFTSLTEGHPVIDWVRKTPLPAGTIVCDANGNTAVIEKRNGKPVIGKTAFTGDRQLINQARKNANANYRVPNI